MTNNLKILTILSIFVFILTGYFCFSSSFTKNQIIANNNEKDDEDPDINNEDSNNNEEKTSKLAILSINVLIGILIVIVVVITIFFFIIIKFKFKFNEESKVDFAKDNFCQTFFLFKYDDYSDGDSFFGTLANNSFCYYKIKDYDNENNNNNSEKNEEVKIYETTKVNKIEIYIKLSKLFPSFDNKLTNDDVYVSSLSDILNLISKNDSFVVPIKNLNNENKDKLRNQIKKRPIDIDALRSKIEHIKGKYGKEFDSYLCSYLLYYLAAEIAKKKINVEIHNNCVDEEGQPIEKGNYNFCLVDKNTKNKETVVYYNLDYSVMMFVKNSIVI